MWRVWVGLLVTFVAWRAGQLAARPYRVRWQSLGHWRAFLDFLETRMAAEGLPLKEIFQEALVAERFAGLQGALAAAVEGIGTPSGTLEHTMATVLERHSGGLWAEERATLHRLFADFGTHNLEDERRRVRQSAEVLANLERQVRQADLERARLLELFGVLTGVAAVIMVL